MIFVLSLNALGAEVNADFQTYSDQGTRLIIKYPACWKDVVISSPRDQEKNTGKSGYIILEAGKNCNPEYAGFWKITFDPWVRKFNFDNQCETSELLIGKNKFIMRHKKLVNTRMSVWGVEFTCKTTAFGLDYAEEIAVTKRNESQGARFPPILKEFLEGIDCSKVK